MNRPEKSKKRSLILKMLLIFLLSAAVLSSGCTQAPSSTSTTSSSGGNTGDIVGKWFVKSDLTKGSAAVEFFANKTVVLGDPSSPVGAIGHGTYGFTDSNHLTITYEETKAVTGPQKFVVVSRSDKDMVLRDQNGNLWTYTRAE